MKAKRILSLVLSIAMLCSIFAVGTINASAEEAPTRLLNNFDGVGNISGQGVQGGAGTATIVDYKTIDPTYTDGNVFELTITKNHQYGGFNIDPSWNYDSFPTPKAIKFQAWTTQDGASFSSGRLGISTVGFSQTEYTAATLGYTGSYEVSKTPTWYTYDISGLVLAGKNITLTFGTSAPVVYYIDNVTLVYDEGATGIVEIEKKIIYDFESETVPEGVSSVRMRSARTGITTLSSYKGTQSYSFQNNSALWNQNGKNVVNDTSSGNYVLSKAYVTIQIPKGLDVKGSVGFYFSPKASDSSNYEAFGVQFEDGSYYFSKYRQAAASGKWAQINMMTETLYSLADNTTTLALKPSHFNSDENRVVAIIVADGGGNTDSDGSRSFIDNVYYEGAVSIGGEEPSTAIKATFDNGVADVEADADGFVTLPEATIEGKQFIGWQDADGALYAAGAKVAIIEDTAFTAVAAAIDLQTGAGIRWAAAEQQRGIRFETYVTKAAIDAIGASDFELGALILPYADYDADITVETASAYGAINVVDPKVYGEVGENYRYYTGVVDFERYFAVSQSALADLKLTAVSYVKVTYADASVGYFYAQPDATDNVRSVAEVARAALADTEFGYTDTQIAILNLYNQYSQETNVPEYRKDDADKIA